MAGPLARVVEGAAAGVVTGFVVDADTVLVGVGIGNVMGTGLVSTLVVELKLLTGLRLLVLPALATVLDPPLLEAGILRLLKAI